MATVSALPYSRYKNLHTIAKFPLQRSITLDEVRVPMVLRLTIPLIARAERGRPGIKNVFNLSYGYTVSAAEETALDLFLKVLTYYGAYPFLPDASSSISPEALLRAVALLSGRGLYQLDSASKMQGLLLMPGKKEGGWRRLLFESFASPIEQPAGQAEEKEQDTTTAHLAVTADPDDSNDLERQILDILTCIQPRLHPSIAPLSPQELQPMARRLCGQSKTLRPSWIPTQQLYGITMLLVACRFDYIAFYGATSRNHKAALDLAARWMSSSFGLVRGNGVGREEFSTVAEHNMPFLFAGLPELMERVLSSTRRGIPVPLAVGKSCGLYHGALPQLLTFLPNDLHKRMFQPRHGYSYTPQPYPHPSEQYWPPLWTLLSDKSVHRIFLLLALPETEPPTPKPDIERSTVFEGKPLMEILPPNAMIFGGFVPATTISIPTPNSSSSTDSLPTVHLTEKKELLASSLIFQLAPLQDVFRVRNLGENPESESYLDVHDYEGHGISFGCSHEAGAHQKGGSGVRLYIDNLTSYGFFSHDTSGEGAYRPSGALGGRRGNLQIDLDVWCMEVISV
ncbi:MAG: hypothetical protein Q9222_007233 [Ikaeria aurantiellina]